MTQGNPADLMKERMALVGKLSALNSKQLSNTQARSGIEVELLACIETIERDGETKETLAHRAELENRLADAIVACTDCDQELDRLANDLIALDQAGPKQGLDP